MAFSLLCISIFTFENLFGTMGWYCTIVTGQLFPCKNRLRNQGISCSWWCLWFSCGVAGTSTSQFFTTISGRVLFRMNGLGGRGCLEEAWIKCHCPKWAVLLNPAFRVSSRMVRHYITPWWCSYLSHVFHCLIVEVLDPPSPFACFFFETTFFGPSIDAWFSDPLAVCMAFQLISKASSETKMWWWQVHSRCSLEHWCLVLRHWKRHLGYFKFN